MAHTTTTVKHVLPPNSSPPSRIAPRIAYLYPANPYKCAKYIPGHSGVLDNKLADKLADLRVHASGVY